MVCVCVSLRKDGSGIATVGGSLLAYSLQRRETCWTSYRCLNRCFSSVSSTCPGPIGLCSGRLTERLIPLGMVMRTQCHPCYMSFLLKTCFGPCRSLGGFSPRRSEFEPGSNRVGSVVDRAAVEQVFPEYFGFPFHSFIPLTAPQSSPSMIQGGYNRPLHCRSNSRVNFIPAPFINNDNYIIRTIFQTEVSCGFRYVFSQITGSASMRPRWLPSITVPVQLSPFQRPLHILGTNKVVS
jgi:hypothetical protein